MLDVELGDPFVLRHAGRFYLYGTAGAATQAGGLAIPAYRSDDLVHWQALGSVLETPAPELDHWAPEVLAWNGKFYMVYSYGDVVLQGHALWVAEAERPVGPFRPVARLSDPGERFSIDGSWLLDDDGRLYLYRCVDFVDEGPPTGTGIVVQPMTDPLTPCGPVATVMRAQAPWHVFEVDRVMPLYEGRRFDVWTTIEGPAPVKRAGRYFCGYSGGNYTGEYGTGEVVADAPLGPYRELDAERGPLFSTVAGVIEGPGHFSVVRPNLVDDWIVLHGRKPGKPARSVWLCPARWTKAGVELGPLLDPTRSSPPLPDVRWHAGMGAAAADRCFDHALGLLDESGWHLQSDGAPRVGWIHSPALPKAWVAEAWVALESPAGRVGFCLEAPGNVGPLAVYHDGRTVAAIGPGLSDEPATSARVPTLGSMAFDAGALHALRLEYRQTALDVWVDEVHILGALEMGEQPVRLGLLVMADAAAGAAQGRFDGVSLTLQGTS